MGDFELSVRDLEVAAPVSALSAMSAACGPRLAPRKVIQTYDDEEWEVFIEEWATGLVPDYVRVQRFGGTGDRGVDVAGFRTDQGFEGEWDCFQGKHYNRSLTLSMVLPEMLKVFLLPVNNPRYRLPQRYSFIAPLGLATSLAHLVSTPSDLRDQFVEKVKSGEAKTVRDLDRTVRDAVCELASATDFSLFGSVEVLSLIDQHSRTRYHAARFGGGLPERPPVQDPPPEILVGEQMYVSKLVDAYREHYVVVNTIAEAEAHHKAGGHFRRQRENFFQAESLRNFARDCVPPRTFESLQDDLYDAVIETADSHHADGLERLRQTLEQAVRAQLSSNVLIQEMRPADRLGMCHQLANDDRLTWVDET